jgi:hypothetical protein
LAELWLAIVLVFERRGPFVTSSAYTSRTNLKLLNWLAAEPLLLDLACAALDAADAFPSSVPPRPDELRLGLMLEPGCSAPQLVSNARTLAARRALDNWISGQSQLQALVDRADAISATQATRRP